MNIFSGIFGLIISLFIPSLLLIESRNLLKNKIKDEINNPYACLIKNEYFPHSVAAFSVAIFIF